MRRLGPTHAWVLLCALAACGAGDDEEERPRVVDEDGAPIPFARLVDVDIVDGDVVSTGIELRADADGFFDDVPSEHADWVATAETFVPQGHDPARQQSIMLSRGGIFTGRVVDETGAGWAGARVGAVRHGAPTWFESAVTDAEGRYEIEGVPVDEPRIVVQVPGAVPVVHELDAGENVIVPRAPRLMLRVTGDEGRPLAGVKLRVRDASDREYLTSATSDAEGSIEIFGRPDEFVLGNDHCVLSAPGYVSVRVPLAELAAATPDGAMAPKRLERGVLLTGTVRFDDGSPVAGAAVQAIAVPSEAAIVMGVRGHGASAQTDASGRYRIDVLPGLHTGRASLRFQGVSYRTREDFRLPAAGEPHTLDWTLPKRPGRVRVRLRGVGKKGAVTSWTAGPLMGGATGGRKRIHIHGVPPGKVDVHVTLDGDPTVHTRTVTVEADAQTAVEFDFR